MSDKDTSLYSGELSFDEAPVKWLLNANDLPCDGKAGTIVADADELQALTKLLNDEHDLEVKSFSCTYELMPKKNAAFLMPTSGK